MFALRLVRLIEEHADRLSEGLLKRLKQSEACHDLLALVPDDELGHRAFEIYRHVSDYLLTRTYTELEERYISLGARRAQQDVPFSQMLYALQAVKENLWDFLRQEDLLEPKELISEFELVFALDRFFDRIAYFASIGYGGARARQVAHALAGHSA
jgi:hypothetical protein